MVDIRHLIDITDTTCHITVILSPWPIHGQILWWLHKARLSRQCHITCYNSQCVYCHVLRVTNVTINILHYLLISLCFFFNYISTSARYNALTNSQYNSPLQTTTVVTVEFENKTWILVYLLEAVDKKSMQFPGSLFDIFNGQYKVRHGIVS